MKSIIRKTLSNFLLFLTIALPMSSKWLFATFDGLSMDEIIFHLKVPMVGANNDFLMQYLTQILSKVIIVFIVIILLKYILIKSYGKEKWKGSKLRKVLILVTISTFVFFSSSIVNKFNVIPYVKDNMKSSLFFEENYVRVNDQILTYPETDRNLIYIFVESYESTFFSKEFGGALDDNPMEPILNLMNNATHFSNNDLFGGAAMATGTSWTVAALVSQTSGVHLKLPIEGNSLDRYSEFLSGNLSIGEILSKRNYNQTFLLGSDANFAGRRNYFEQHGDYAIHDYFYAKEFGLIPEDYLQWWGYEDQKLYDFAKDELTQLAAMDEPFNLTMLTADTHHVDGYPTPGMEEPFDQQYKNVIFNSSKQLAGFIEWVEQQDFYENTTIVISGDHHTMDAPFIHRNVSDDYERKILNLFINSVVDPINVTNRDFATFDLFPSTLASLGFTIENDRLGIGTDLFSGTPTLFEQFGIEEVNAQLSLNSKYYKNNIIVNNEPGNE